MRFKHVFLDHARMHMRVTLFATCWQPPWSSRLHSMRCCSELHGIPLWFACGIQCLLAGLNALRNGRGGSEIVEIIESECHVFYFLVASNDKLSTHTHKIHTNSCWWKQAWVICIRVQVDSLHSREVVMWTSRMFLIDSGCLKAEQRSTAPPLYHIRGAAVVFFLLR